MLRDNLNSPRVFQDNDPWLFSILNTSLDTMKVRDEQLADAIDSGGGFGGVLVDVEGSATPTILYAPAGWAVSRISDGVYLINHTYNTTSYTVFPGVVSSTFASIYISDITTSSFKISTVDSTGTPLDVRFTCFIARYA